MEAKCKAIAMEKTLAYLRRICAQREYCSKDIYEKALRRFEKTAATMAEPDSSPEDDSTLKDGSLPDGPAMARKAVNTLKEEGFLCDARYARSYARDKASLRGWGPAKISFMLRSKGIDDNDIKAALSEIDSEKSDRKILAATEKKAVLLKNDPQIKIKLIRFVSSRGYTYESTQEIVSRVLSKTK